jgi:hypothetical protein
MTDPFRPAVVLDDEARGFLRGTGVLVIAIEVAVVAAIWAFQWWFGR